MKLYDVDFKGVQSVGNCLLIVADTLSQARKIAKKTIKHTDEFSIKRVKANKPRVVKYLSGDY